MPAQHCTQPRCRLVVLAMEVGGRWSPEAATFLRLLVQTKARETPAPLRHTVVASLIARWSAILTHAVMQAFAASLLNQSADNALSGDGVLPPPSGNSSPKHHPPPLPPVDFQNRRFFLFISTPRSLRVNFLLLPWSRPFWHRDGRDQCVLHLPALGYSQVCSLLERPTDAC